MISNAVTLLRTFLTLPLFALLAYGGGEHRGAALALFLSAGLLDIADGKIARGLGEVSDLGALLDLVGDRLLTFAAVLGLIVGGQLAGATAIAGMILIARDLLVASLNEALPGKLDIRVSLTEKLKIAAAFAGLTLLIAPDFMARQDQIGAGVLWLAAALTLWTLLGYGRRALRAFQAPST